MSRSGKQTQTTRVAGMMGIVLVKSIAGLEMITIKNWSTDSEPRDEE